MCQNFTDYFNIILSLLNFTYFTLRGVQENCPVGQKCVTGECFLSLTFCAREPLGSSQKIPS